MHRDAQCSHRSSICTQIFKAIKITIISKNYDFYDEYFDNCFGHREVFFETNGVPRVVEVKENVAKSAATNQKASRERGDPGKAGNVSAPMNGDVIDIKVKAGLLPLMRLMFPILIFDPSSKTLNKEMCFEWHR